jgi:plasmid stabilization system protein ParE
MAVNLIWTQVAQDDLEEVIGYIRNENPSVAKSFSKLLIDQVELLADFPELGHVVPERDDPQIREIGYRNYRIIYRLTLAKDIVEIVRIWHAARGTPEFKE